MARRVSVRLTDDDRLDHFDQLVDQHGSVADALRFAIDQTRAQGESESGSAVDHDRVITRDQQSVNQLDHVVDTVDAIADELGVDLEARRRDDALDELASSWDEQGDADRERRKDVLRMAWEWIRTDGARSSADIRDPLWDEWQDRVAWTTKESMWSWVQPRLKQLPHVKHGGGQRYEFA